MDEDDKKIFEASKLSLGAIDDEIHVVRTQLARVIRSRAQQEQRGEDLQIETEESTPHCIIITRKPPDYDGLIIRYTGRIESLEKTRRELLATDSNGDKTLNLNITGGLPPLTVDHDDIDSGVKIITPQGF